MIKNIEFENFLDFIQNNTILHFTFKVVDILYISKYPNFDYNQDSIFDVRAYRSDLKRWHIVQKGTIRDYNSIDAQGIMLYKNEIVKAMLLHIDSIQSEISAKKLNIEKYIRRNP
jgi:hypothetical protein